MMKILPCPGCGSQASVAWDYEPSDQKPLVSVLRYDVGCEACTMVTPDTYPTREDAIRAWNFLPERMRQIKNIVPLGLTIMKIQPCALCGYPPFNGDWLGRRRCFGCPRCKNFIEYTPAGERRLRAVIRLWNFRQRKLKKGGTE